MLLKELIWQRKTSNVSLFLFELFAYYQLHINIQWKIRGAVIFWQVLVLSEQWYADVLARIRINAFRIEMVAGSYDDLLTLAAASVEAEAGVGNAVYILPSFYNHDCGEPMLLGLFILPLLPMSKSQFYMHMNINPLYHGPKSACTSVLHQYSSVEWLRVE